MVELGKLKEREVKKMTKKQFNSLRVGDKIIIENTIITIDKRRLLKDGFLFLGVLYPPKSIKLKEKGGNL